MKNAFYKGAQILNPKGNSLLLEKIKSQNYCSLKIKEGNFSEVHDSILESIGV
ncbi:hypothetical protein LSS_06375 [Leptospira santarosai serovar Shermani str. LT 821]|uniref:Uncharacterized protein n=1 Tax=Leptospira santarosai serovar Shermani str. LT 821 TaxID=758847 RepID=K8YE06_9LEPT|nr:hypothetical protein LSS_06375 [Leptospira santarosai serovar Shermani str. LT 821]